MLAPVNGRGFDEDLARDFADEDLWDARRSISFRWLKFLLAYTLSALAQVTAPILVVAVVVAPFQRGDHAWRWWLVAIAIGTCGGIIAALLATTGAYLKILGKSNLERKRLQRVVDSIPKAIGALILLGVTGLYMHLLIFGAPK